MKLETREFPDGKERRLEKGATLGGLKTTNMSIRGKQNAVQFDLGFGFWEIRSEVESGTKL